MSKPNKPSAEYYLLLPSFIKKFFHSTPNLSIQKFWKINRPGKKQFAYNPISDKLDQILLTNHFYLTPIDRGGYLEGSLAVVPLYPGNVLKFVCIDIDKPELKEKALTQLLPVIESYGFNTILEHGGELDAYGNYTRAHIWIPLEASPQTCKKIFTQIFSQAGCDLVEEFDEVNGVNKVNNLIRLPLGPHMSRGGTVFPIEIDGKLSYDPVDFLKAFINADQITEDRILEMILPEFDVEEKKIDRPTFKVSETFRYKKLNLPEPIEDVPFLLEPVVSNCQAINQILSEVKNKGLIKKRGEIYHTAGLWIQRLAIFNDIKSSAKLKKKITSGESWWNYIQSKYRNRDSDSHNWDSNRKEMEQFPEKFFPSCKSWEEKFNKCNGCPFKGSISSPRVFITGEPVRKTLIGKVNLLIPTEVQATTFKKFKNRVHYLTDNALKQDILLSCFQGAGKSYTISELTAELSRKGKKVLIAVPTSELAMEQKKRLKQLHNVESFVLMSHKNIFSETGLSNFDCPSYPDIQDQVSLGVPSLDFKSKICQSCPYLNRCAYPNQYKQVMEDSKNIVIIQHAHLQCQEVVYELLKKSFDVLFIDESFISSCYASVPIDSRIPELLDMVTIPWANSLGRWLKGKGKFGTWINPTDSELAILKHSFDEAGLAWQIPDFIRYHNQKRTVNPVSGIEIVYELPNIPIRVFTDATPPEDLIKAVTGIDNIVTFGAGEVQDIKRIHSENEIIQVLDSSASVSSLEDGNKLDLILTKIAELVELKYTSEKVLLTVYKRHFEVVEKFFLDHILDFPTARSRITIDCMDKGTNAYEDYDVQFLLAGFHFTGGQYETTAYKYKTVNNYYNFKYGKKQLQNLYPYDSSMETSVPIEKCAIRRIEKLSDGSGGLYEYSDIPIYEPLDTWHKLIYNYNIANTQQAIRLRFKPDKKRIVYVLSNLNLPSMVITESIFLRDFVRPLDKLEALY